MLSEKKVNLINGVRVESFNDEQMAVWKEALYKSRGQTNNKIGAELVALGASSDEVVRFAGRAEGYKAVRPKRHTKLLPKERIVKQVFDCIPNYWETVQGRKLKGKPELLAKAGLNPSKKLPVTKLKVSVSQYYINRSLKAADVGYCCFEAQEEMRYDSTVARKLMVVSVFEPIAEVKFKPDVSGKSPLEVLADKTASPGSKAFSHYDEYRDYEIDSFAHMDESVTEQISPIQLVSDCISNEVGYNLTNHPTSSYAIETSCVIEGFYAVCKEMGIAGILNQAVSGRSYCSSASIIGIMKQVIKMGGTYRRLVKGGFAESVARATVLTEINDAIARRATRPIVRFYPRNDYADTPEEERVKAPKRSSGSGGGKKTISSWESFIKSCEEVEGGSQC